MSVTVRPARASDAGFIARNNVAMALEAEHKVLDPSIAAAGVANALADDSKGRYFVAERDGTAIGQLMITYEWSDWRNGTFWWIQSVYVLPEARRGGVFRTLFEYLAQAARRDPSVCGIRLYVDHDNERAQATYRGCGLTDAGYRVMEIDYSGAVRAPDGG
jgi:ribosomal protein S18 acetylase RimI-like enzyme